MRMLAHLAIPGCLVALGLAGLIAAPVAAGLQRLQWGRRSARRATSGARMRRRESAAYGFGFGYGCGYICYGSFGSSVPVGP